MDFAKVNVEVRTGVGKGGARKVRAAGKVPGVIYGQKKDPMTVTFDEKELLSSLDKEKKRNTVLKLAVTGNGTSEEVVAMVREAQINALSRRLEHVDFLRVDLDKEVQVTVPLVLTGKPVGVTNGGNLHQSLHVVPVAAKPAAIPSKLEVDVSGARRGLRAPRQRSQAPAPACASCSRRATRSPRWWRRRPRRSRKQRRLPSRARCRRKARRPARPPRPVQLARPPRPAARRKAAKREAARRRASNALRERRPCTSWLGSGTLVGSTRPTDTIWDSWSPTSFWRGAAAPRRAPNLAPSSAEIAIGSERVLLCKPMEFMNVSGQAVARAATFWKVPVSNTIVVHDELDVPFGRIKLAAGGGAGGHNGIRSMLADLGDPGFARVRVGIGRPAPGRDGADYVLSDFSRAEAKELPDLVALAAEAVEAIVTDGIAAAMNRFNGKAKDSNRNTKDRA